VSSQIARQARANAARQRRRAAYRSAGPRPDRVAAWAVALGVIMILLAGATSRADTTGGATAPPAVTGGSNGAADPALVAGSDAARIAALPTQLATWYGPGFYGRRTACGIVLHRSTQGVAHKTLPCGTPVTFYYQGRLKIVQVIDRGPFARRVTWDLTRATAQELGVRRTSRVHALH
jgi:rare lipoprotein A